MGLLIDYRREFSSQLSERGWKGSITTESYRKVITSDIGFSLFNQVVGRNNDIHCNHIIGIIYYDLLPFLSKIEGKIINKSNASALIHYPIEFIIKGLPDDLFGLPDPLDGDKVREIINTAEEALIGLQEMYPDVRAVLDTYPTFNAWHELRGTQWVGPISACAIHLKEYERLAQFLDINYIYWKGLEEKRPESSARFLKKIAAIRKIASIPIHTE